jgi:hypothetical protein
MVCPPYPPGGTTAAAAPGRCYLRPAVEARRIVTIAAVGMLALAGCGGGERQDADEPEGNFEVEVVDASFPGQQRLAQSSDLVIKVRNAGSETIPDIAVTVDGLNYRATADDVQLSDPSRPRFAVNGVPRQIGGFPESKDATPKGCDTAYVNTWACGPLKPGAEHAFKWSVTAVKAGPYKLAWRVEAGLDGKARAVSTSGGEAVGGTFTGTISDKPPHTRIADDGKTVVVDP